MPQDPRPTLLTLPGELRNKITSHLLQPRTPGTSPPPSLRKSSLALPWTCRQLYAEYASLARRQSATYPFSWHSAAHLAATTRALLAPTCAAEIARVLLWLPVRWEGMYDGGRRRVLGFEFAGAGMVGVEEVWFCFRGGDVGGGGGGEGGGAARELVVLVLWRMLWEKKMVRLRRIGFVHHGTQPLLSLTLLLGMLRSFKPLAVSTRWRVQSDLEHGRLVFVEREGEGMGRRIEVLVGYSFREAEEYVQVCEDILEGKHADVITARRRDCKYVTPLDEMTDDELRQEVDNLHTLFPVCVGDQLLLQPHVDRIRAMCRLGS